MAEFYSPKWFKEIIGFIVTPIPAVLILYIDGVLPLTKHYSLLQWLGGFWVMTVITYYYYACGLIPLIIVYLLLKYVRFLSTFSLILVGIAFSYIERSYVVGTSPDDLPMTILLGVVSGYTLAFFTVNKVSSKNLTDQS